MSIVAFDRCDRTAFHWTEVKEAKRDEVQQPQQKKDDYARVIYRFNSLSLSLLFFSFSNNCIKLIQSKTNTKRKKKSNERTTVEWTTQKKRYGLLHFSFIGSFLIAFVQVCICSSSSAHCLSEWANVCARARASQRMSKGHQRHEKTRKMHLFLSALLSTLANATPTK